MHVKLIQPKCAPSAVEQPRSSYRMASVHRANRDFLMHEEPFESHSPQAQRIRIAMQSTRIQGPSPAIHWLTAVKPVRILWASRFQCSPSFMPTHARKNTTAMNRRTYKDESAPPEAYAQCPPGRAINVRITGRSRPKNRNGAKLMEKAVRHIKIMAADPDVTAVPFNQRASAVVSDFIGNHRSQIAPDRARRSHPEKLTGRYRPGIRQRA